MAAFWSLGQSPTLELGFLRTDLPRVAKRSQAVLYTGRSSGFGSCNSNLTSRTPSTDPAMAVAIRSHGGTRHSPLNVTTPSRALTLIGALPNRGFDSSADFT